ncbi:MAG: tetratricopeptide repeat protein [Deltaproteobacteria bacterium]|nr:tetratricopeptide repeat protein [Deltaproteobacteria bacterium]
MPAGAAGRSGAERFYNRGEALARQGQVDAAIIQFDKAVRLDPRNAAMRTRLAWLLLDENQPEAALPHFERLVYQRPADQAAISGLAITYMQLGQPERAVVVLRQGRQFHPRDKLLLKLQGEALASRGATAAEAMKVYDELLKIKPGKREWLKGRRTAALMAADHSYREGKAHLARGERAAALRAFTRAMELNPDSPGYRTHYGWALLEDGQPARAAAAFQEAIRLDPRKQDAYLGLAMAQWRAGDPAETLKTTQRGLELFPDDVQLLDVQGGAATLQLAGIRLEQGRTNDAERLFKEVLQKDPVNTEANLGLARLNLSNDAYGQAQRHYEKALAEAPENQEAAAGLDKVTKLMRPQLQTHGGVLEDSDSFRRSYVYTSWQSYLTPELRATLGYGYLNYTMGNDSFRGRLRERSAHRHIIPVNLTYRPYRKLVLELGGAFSDYGVWGQSGSGRASLFYQATADSGFSLSYAYYDIIDYYGPFKGPWGRHVDEFADMERYRYLVIDPTALWTQNIFGASSTQAITDHIRTHEVAFWGYKNLFSRLILSLYGSVSPYNDGNVRKNLGTTVTFLALTDPLLKFKYSFFYLGFNKRSADLANLPPGSAPLYWDPIAFKNHSWGVVFEKNLWGRVKLALEGDMLYTPGAPTPGALVFLEVDVLLTRNLALRTMGFYLNSVDVDRTSYQVRSIMAGLSYRF